MQRLATLVGLLLVVATLAWVARLVLRPVWRKARPLRDVLRPAAPWIAAGLVLFGDLALDAAGTFGVADGWDTAVYRGSSLLYGPVYGGLSREGQDRIVVVALDEAFVDRSSGAWPPPYSATASVLAQVAAARPKAIFLDLYFSSAHRLPDGSLDDNGVLELAGAMASARPAPVFTGPISASELEPLKKQATEVDLALRDGRPFSYNLQGPDRPSAAAALYSLPGEPKPPPHANTLALDWGFGASAWLKRHWPEPDNPCIASTLPERFAGFGALLWRGLAPEAARSNAREEQLVVACPYFDMVPAGRLSEPSVQARLKDRLVLVGPTVPWLADTHATPFLGDVPGVLVHAMALDNLIEGGPQATHYPDPARGLGGLDNADLVQAALLALGFGMVFAAHKRFALPADASLPVRAKAGIWIFIMCFGLVIAGLNQWPLFKLIGAALTGGICLEAWERLQKHSPHY